MKQKIILILRCVLAILIACAFIFKMWQCGVFIPKNTAVVNGESIVWNGMTYSSICGVYSEGRTIAKGENDWVVNAVKEDPSHTFVVVRSFLDQYLMVSDDYEVPINGILTSVAWNGRYISDNAFLTAIAGIQAEKTTSFIYETEGIFVLNENQCMKSVYFAYNDCPVATNYVGYMGKINGEWVITLQIKEESDEMDESKRSYFVECFRIPEHYWDILSAYFELD